MSRALGITKKSWSTYAKEILAIVEAIRWDEDLSFKSTNAALSIFLEQKITTLEQQQWLAKLMGFEYEIQYRPEREYTAADALSLRPERPTLNKLFMAHVSIWEEIKKNCP